MVLVRSDCFVDVVSDVCIEQLVLSILSFSTRTHRVEKGEEALAAAEAAESAASTTQPQANHSTYTIGVDDTMTCSLGHVMALGANNSSSA